MKLCSDCVIEKRTDCALAEAREDPTATCWAVAQTPTTAVLERALEGAFELPLQEARRYVAGALREIDLTRVEGKSYDEVAKMLSTSAMCWRSFRQGAALGAAVMLGLGIGWAAADWWRS